MEEEQVYTYKANFILTNPVSDMKAAYDFLTEDNMTKYLWSSITNGTLSSTSLRLVCDRIKNIIWILKTENSGSIYLKSSVKLTEEQLSLIADFVYSQNTEGLGYDFSRQSFSVTGADGKCSEFDSNCKIEFVLIQQLLL